MRKTSVALLTLAVFFGACSGSSGPDPAEDPKAALMSAFDRLGDGGYTFTLKLDSDPDSPAALSSEEGGSPMAADDAQKLLDSSLSVSTTDEENPEERSSQVLVNVAGNEDAVEARGIDKALYLRADVREIAEMLGESTADLEQMVATAPPGFEFIGAAIEGEWLALGDLEELTQKLGGGMAPTPDADSQQQFVEDLGAALEASSEVTSEGDDDAGHHLIAKVAVKQFYGQIRDSFGALVGDLPAGTLPSVEDVPDEEISFEVWVDDDRVTQMRLDFIQLERFGDEPVPEGVERLALLVEVDGFGDSVDVPEDAVEVDLAALMQTLIQTGMGAGATPPVTGAPPGGVEDLCDQLAGAPPEILEQFSDQCPELAQ